MVAKVLTSAEQLRQNNKRLRQTAHERLDALIDDAEREQLYGQVNLEITFQSGEIKLVRRHKDGTDK